MEEARHNHGVYEHDTHWDAKGQHQLQYYIKKSLSNLLFCSISTTSLPNFNITYICDNNDLICNCEDRLTYNKPFPNATLCPEFDLIDEIY